MSAFGQKRTLDFLSTRLQTDVVVFHSKPMMTLRHKKIKLGPIK